MSTLESPTNEYNMRHTADVLARMARDMDLTADQMGTIDWAYQQLHQGANMLHNLMPLVGPANRQMLVIPNELDNSKTPGPAEAYVDAELRKDVMMRTGPLKFDAAGSKDGSVTIPYVMFDAISLRVHPSEINVPKDGQ